MMERFEAMLAGGHPNSLGRTVEVVDCVLAEPDRFEELFDCYQSADEVVRLRVSSALKRVEDARHDLLVPYLERLLTEISEIDQASTQWTLAQLFDRLRSDMDASQHGAALGIMQRNLATGEDWIVLNTTMEVLATWAKGDDSLKAWLLPHLERLASDPRKSVSGRAQKKLSAL